MGVVIEVLVVLDSCWFVGSVGCGIVWFFRVVPWVGLVLWFDCVSCAPISEVVLWLMCDVLRVWVELWSAVVSVCWSCERIVFGRVFRAVYCCGRLGGSCGI